MANLRQNAGLDLPIIIVPLPEIHLPEFEVLPDNGWPLLLSPPTLTDKTPQRMLATHNKR